MSKNGPNSPDFKEKKVQMTRFLSSVPVGSQEYIRILFFWALPTKARRILSLDLL